VRPNVPRPGLQLKIVAWSFVPAAIILLGVAFVSFSIFQAVLEALMIENNRETTEVMAGQIGAELETLVDELRGMARTPGLLGGDASATRAALQASGHGVATFDGGVVVLNRQGTVVAAEPARESSSPEDWSSYPFLRQMLYSPGPILSDIFFDSPRNGQIVSLAVPITAADGQFLGAIAGLLRVDSSSMLARRLASFRSWPDADEYDLTNPGPVKSTLLVDHNGRIVFHSEASQIGRNISSETAVQAVSAGKHGPISSSEFRDQQVVTYFAPVPKTGWGFLVEQQRSTVIDFYRRYFQLQTVLFGLALLVPAGLVALGVRHITEPIRRVTTASRQIATGDLQQVVHVRTGDELEELANQFNRMSAQLRESYNALKEREERLALVIRATNDGIWDWDLKTNRVYFSPRWKEMLGYADDEIGNTFDDWRRLVHPDDAGRALALTQDYSQGKTSSYEIEHRLKHKDGSYRWVLARGISLCDSSGKPYRIVGSHTDITDRKKIEETLQARLAFERLITGISTEFINLAPNQIDAGIQRALKAIGEFVRVDRSYVFLIASDGATTDTLYEWCADGIESFIGRIRSIPLDTFAWSMERFKRLEAVYVPSLGILPPEASAEKQEFELEGIKSLINVPIAYRGTLVGFLGLDSVLTEKTWSDDTIALLRIAGEIFANALEHKREQGLQAGQRHFLELLAMGGDFSAMLHTLIRIVEEQWRGMLGLILLLDNDGRHLHIGASVTLPQDYVDSIEGLEIGPMVGSCGTACYRRERVIVEDILTDPRWDGLRSLAVRYGIRACWSEPVIAANGQVVGTFAMYYRQPRSPTADELRTIETAGHLVGIAIEHQQAQEALVRSEAELRVAYESLERRVQERTRELAALNSIAGVASQSLDLHEIMRDALDQTMQVCGMDAGAAYELDDDSQTLALVAAKGLSEEFTQRMGARVPLQAALPGQTLAADRPLVRQVAHDYAEGESKQVVLREGLESLFTVPLVAKGKIVGAFGFGSRKPRALTTEESALFSAVGRQVGIAVENAQFYRRERERHQEAERRRLVAEGMREIIAVLNSKQTLRDILDFIATQACRVLASDAAIIFRLQEKNGPLVIQSTFGLPDLHFSNLRFSIREGATWQALIERRPQFISDAAGARKTTLERQMPVSPERAWAMRMFDAYPSVLAAPLIVKGEDYGVLTLFYRAPREFSEEEISLSSAVANQAALAIESARLHEQAQQMATTAERSRLARELHDSVTQSLYSVMLYAEAAARSLADKEIAEAGDFLKELRDTSQDALREMRLLIFELRPPTLEKDGLIGALRTRLNAVEGRGGMKTELHVNDDRRAEQLPFSLQEAVYHIVQEALNNVIRHAHAQSVRVCLELSEKAIQLQVSDDGIGFDPQSADESSGLGLRGMRERVQRIGGSVQITSAPGKGTLVTVLAPNANGRQES
jgi:PAS domain S-box-containing protein